MTEIFVTNDFLKISWHTSRNLSTGCLRAELDDYSRYIISWRLTTTMAASDVTDTLEDALHNTGLISAKVHHRPRLLSDNGPCYISKELREWLQNQDMQHTRGAPYTGIFHGAAGIGLAFLRLHARLEGKQAYLRLPDDPFVWPAN